MKWAEKEEEEEVRNIYVEGMEMKKVFFLRLITFRCCCCKTHFSNAALYVYMTTMDGGLENKNK